MTFPMEPVVFGPTWSRGEDREFELPSPHETVGYRVALWAEQHLRQPDGDHAGGPLRLTNEQWRFLAHWYRVDEHGRFAWRTGTFMRIKGAGKDLLGAVLSLAELCGPCRPVRDDEGRVVADGNGLLAQPVAAPWVQLAAVSIGQTQNTMRHFPSLLSDEFIDEYHVDLGKVTIYAGSSGKLEAVTSSPRTLEGGRPTFVLANEALALDTPLPTPSGWTTMGRVQAGDFLVGSDGSSVAVTYCTEPQRDRVCYRVAFEDGTSVVASDGHLWQTRRASSGAKPQVRTTADMVADGGRFRVPQSAGLRTPDMPVPIDPYVLGLWLGDGNADRPIITVSEDDAEETAEAVRGQGFTTKWCKSSGAPRFQVSVEGARRNRNDFKTTPSLYGQLSAAGLIRNKHIPSEYFRAGYDQRLALVRGLMDSDGCATARGGCVFVNNNEALASGLMELLRSLGQRPFRKWRPDTRSRAAGTHRVEFAARGIVPFSLTRKAARVRQAAAISDWLSITSITPVESVPVKCVEVDAADHLFLAGEGWTATHNTHHWVSSNHGHDMYAVIARNLAKAARGSARVLEITNAHAPGEDSIAERSYDAHLQRLGRGDVGDHLFDALQAPAEVDLSDPDSVREGLRIARGDAEWLDLDTYMSIIVDPRSSTADSRRFFLNQVVARDRSLIAPVEWDRCLRRGAELEPGDVITLGFDGSKSQDATALVACRVSDRCLFPIAVQESDPNDPDWRVDRDMFDAAVDRCFDRYNVQAFFADVIQFEAEVEQWDVSYRRGLKVKAAQRSAVGFDMRGNDKRSTAGVEAFAQAVTDNAIGHNGDAMLRAHTLNAVRRPNRWGVSFGKEHRESRRKVDAFAAALLADIARRELVMSGRYRGANNKVSVIA